MFFYYYKFLLIFIKLFILFIKNGFHKLILSPFFYWVDSIYIFQILIKIKALF